MALSKKMLQAMGLEDAQIDQIIEAHRESINGLTETRDQYKADLDKYKAEAERLAKVEKDLVRANARLEEAEETDQKLKDLQKQFDDYKADVDKKATRAEVEKVYRSLLREAGIPDKRFDAIIRVSNLDDVKVGKDGKLEGSDKLLEGIKNEWADFIVTEGKQGAKTSTPPDNNGGNTFEKMSLAEKMAYANENPNNAEVQAWLK